MATATYGVVPLEKDSSFGVPAPLNFLGTRESVPASLNLHWLSHVELFAASLTAKTKILLGFYQIVTVLSTTYSTRLPPEYTRWTDALDAVADAVSIDWSGFFLPQQCLGYGLRLLAIALSPVALIALLIIAGVCLRLHPWRAAPAPHARPWYAEAALGLLDLTPAGLVLIFCFVPSITASIFRAWSCQARPADECRCSQPHTSALAMCC